MAQSKNTFYSQIKRYAGNYFTLIPIAMLLAAASAVFNIIPYLYIWLIAKELLLNWGDLLQTDLLISYGWKALLFSVLGILLYFIALLTSHIAAFRVERNMRSYSMKQLLKMPLGFFNNNSSGQTRKVIDDNASITHGFIAHQLPDLCNAFIIPICFIVFTLIVDWRFGIAALIPLIIGFAFIKRMTKKGNQESIKNYLDALETMNTEAVEYIRGMPVVKVFQQSIYSFKRFHNSINNYRDWAYNYTLQIKRPMTLLTLTLQGVSIALTLVCIFLIDGNANYKEVVIHFIFFILFIPLCIVTMNKIMHTGKNYSTAKEAVDRIDNLLYNNEQLADGNLAFPKDHTITFNKVSFSYDSNQNNNAISNISFTIPHSHNYAIVGPSGSGKTTIARLIPRFWDISSGSITIGGTDIKDISTKALMTQVSFVFQNSKLFNTSILENIRYSKPAATIEEVEKVVQLAQCQDIIDKLPNGLNTVIGTKGVYLSGGEQQRLSLARAILKEAPILILDEATAFADPENEVLIQKALNTLMKNKTVLVVAHRLSSIINSDSILVMENGHLVEQGKHSELLKNKRLYSSMWSKFQKAAEWKLTNE